MVDASVDDQVTSNPNLLAENLEEVDQKVKAMLKLMEEDGDSVEKDGMCYVRKPELVAHVEEFQKMYKCLAKRFDQLTGESYKSVDPMQNTVDSHPSSAEDSTFFTPAQKLGLNKFGQKSVGYDTILSSGDGSLDLSFKEGSQSSSSSSSDSESESFVSAVNKKSNSHVIEGEDYAALLKRVDVYKKELIESNQKLLQSEEEVAWLNNELKKKESATVLIGDLQSQVESQENDIKVGESDLEVEKITVLVLLEKIAELESQISESDSTIETLVEELKIARQQLKERTERHLADLSDRDYKIKEMKTALSDAHANFSSDKEKLQSDISILSKLHGDKETKLNSLHEAQRLGLCSEIERLKADVADRGELVEALNKNLDILKVKYDMLLAEKDGLDAKLEMYKAEMCSRDNHIQQLEEQKVELIAGLKNAEELAEEQKLRIGELEEEVNTLRIVIQERAEEKIEAIKQLCFSLEHYRTGYQQLRQAFTENKHRAVSAA